MLRPGFLRLRLASWSEPEAWVQAVFANMKLFSVNEYADQSDELDLPWDIVGFDSWQLPGNRWRFVLHCDVIEWCFEAEWPVIEKG